MAFVETSFFKGINFYTNTKLIPFESVTMENLQYFIKIYVEIEREENFVNINIKLNYLHCIYNNETLTGFLLLIFLILLFFIVVVNIVLFLKH